LITLGTIDLMPNAITLAEYHFNLVFCSF
jgi:hypothetical protein